MAAPPAARPSPVRCPTMLPSRARHDHKPCRDRASRSRDYGAMALAPVCLGPAQRHAGAADAGHQTPLLVEDIALDQSNGAPALDHMRLGPQRRLPHRLEEVDLQLEGGEALALLQAAE